MRDDIEEVLEGVIGFCLNFRCIDIIGGYRFSNFIIGKEFCSFYIRFSIMCSNILGVFIRGCILLFVYVGDFVVGDRSRYFID